MNYDQFTSEIMASDTRLTDHPTVARRCIALVVELYDPDELVSEARMRKKVRRRYIEKHGFIEMIIIGIIVQLLVKAIMAWINNRKDSRHFMRFWQHDLLASGGA